MNGWPTLAPCWGIDCTMGVWDSGAAKSITNDPGVLGDSPSDTLKSTVTGPNCWLSGGVQVKSPDGARNASPPGLEASPKLSDSDGVFGSEA